MTEQNIEIVVLSGQTPGQYLDQLSEYLRQYGAGRALEVVEAWQNKAEKNANMRPMVIEQISNLAKALVFP